MRTGTGVMRRSVPGPGAGSRPARSVKAEAGTSRYGATSFVYGWEGQRVALAFTADGRQIRFILPLPDRTERRFTHTGQE